MDLSGIIYITVQCFSMLFLVSVRTIVLKFTYFESVERFFLGLLFFWLEMNSNASQSASPQPVMPDALMENKIA